MPIYTFRCPDKHINDKRVTGFDVETIDCPTLVPSTAPGTAGNVSCDKPATRRPFYEDTGVSFPGAGFTKTVIPPPPPKAGTKPGEPTADWYERLDRHAERTYRDDEDVQPYRKQQAEKMLKEREGGAIA